MRDFALGLHLTRWHHAVRHDLSASDSQTLSVSELLGLASAADRARWDALPLGYADPRGSEELRAAVADTYERIGSDDIACFTGAQEGLYAAMRALLAPGDHAVVVIPAYQALETVPQAICDVTAVPLDPPGRDRPGWALDPDRLAAAIRPNTRLLMVNVPNNPTGHIPPRAVFDAVVALCRRHGLWLFSDEVYRMIERDPALRLPQAADAYERGLSLGTLAKAYGLPGLRVGWVACPDRAVLARVARVRHYLSGSGAGPSEALGTIALRARDAVLARNRGIADRNRALLHRWFARHPALFEWQDPDGGIVAFPRYRGTDGVERFADRLIGRHGILVLPASVYRSELGETPPDRFRLGFGRADLPAGLAALDGALVGAAGTV